VGEEHSGGEATWAGSDDEDVFLVSGGHELAGLGGS
jgi:hypothetical protein